MEARDFASLLDGEFLRPELEFEREFGMHRNWWLRDKRIAGRAGFLFLYLLSHKADYRVTQATAQAAIGWGKASFLTARRELEDAGYLRAVETRAPSGAKDSEGRPIGGHRRISYELLDPVPPSTAGQKFEVEHVLDVVQEKVPAIDGDDSWPVDKPRTKIGGGFIKPVDNSEIPYVYGEEASAENPHVGEPAQAGPHVANPAEGFRPLNKTKYYKTKFKQDSSSSMENVEPDGAPLGEEEDDSVIVDRDLANVLRGLHSRLDATVLVDRLQRSGLVEVAALDLGLAAVEIIGGSARAVGDPVAYVSKAILAEPWRWARDPLPPVVVSGGGLRPPTLSECASQGHKWVGPWREMCAGCGAERSGWRDDRDRDGIEAAS